MNRSPKTNSVSEQSDNQNDEASSSNSSNYRTFTLQNGKTKNRRTYLPEIHKQKNYDPIQDGIMGYMNRELKTDKVNKSPQKMYGSKLHQKREKSARRKSKHREHKTLDDIEAQTANENILKYLKQCSQQEEEQLTGDIEIGGNLTDGPFEEDHLTKYRKYKHPPKEIPEMHQLKEKQKFKRPRTDITVALQELSDDVVLANEEIYNPFTPVVSPTEACPARGSERIYVQTDRGFRAVSKDKACGRHVVMDAGVNIPRLEGGSDLPRAPPCVGRDDVASPLDIAIWIQRQFLHFGIVAYGLLAGVALLHSLILKLSDIETEEFLNFWIPLAIPFKNTFNFLCVFSVVAVFDKFDVSHLDCSHISDLLQYKKVVFVILSYMLTLGVTLFCTHLDDKIALSEGLGLNETEITDTVKNWVYFSYIRNILSFINWIFICFAGDIEDEMFYTHLVNLNKYQ